jgi:urease beta subunit
MIPGEYFHDPATLELNAGRPVLTLSVNNTGDRPVQIGSHFHFFEVNRALVFDRAAAYGMRLDLPSGTAIRFEPGEIKTVHLVPLAGQRRAYGGSALVMGPLDDAAVRQASLDRLRKAGFGDSTSSSKQGQP